MSDVIQDLRYGFRQLRRSPVLSSVAAISLAVGIVASTSMFAVYYGFVHAPLPYANQDDLQTFSLVNLTTTDIRESLPTGTYFDLRESLAAFESMAAWRVANVTLTGGVRLKENDVVLSAAAGSDRELLLLEGPQVSPKNGEKSAYRQMRDALARGERVVSVSGSVDRWSGRWPDVLRKPPPKSWRILVTSFQIDKE